MPYLSLLSSSFAVTQWWNTLSDVLMIKWSLLFFLCFVLIILTTLSHRRERKYYQRLVTHATNADTVTLDYGLRLLSRSARNYFLFSISFIVLLFCVVFYDIKQHHLVEVSALQRTMASCEQEQAMTEPAATGAEPAAVPADSTASLAAILPSRALEGDEEDALDALKRRYEKAYVNFYLLYQCREAPAEDLAVLEAALSLEAAPFGQTADFVPLVRQASVGTYQELYQNFDCTSPDLATATTSHQQQLEAARHNLQRLSQPAPAPVVEMEKTADPAKE